MTTASLGWTAFAMGDFPAACRWSVAAIDETYQLGDLGTTTISLHVGVLMAAMIGRVRGGGAADGRVRWPLGAVRDQATGRARAGSSTRWIRSRWPAKALSPDAYAAAYEAGRRMTLEEAVALVKEVGASVPAA